MATLDTVIVVHRWMVGRWPLALVALAAVAAHAPALWNGFIWLDHAHIEEGLALAQGGEWAAVFLRGFAGTGFYRPLMSLSLSVDAALGGAPWLYHVTTLFFHAMAAALTVVAAEALGLARRAAVIAGLLFAVHPGTSLVASAIAFRSESMIAVALLALVIFHIRGRPVGAGVALFAGALTKETALVLGPLFVTVLVLTPNHAGRTRSRLLAAEAGALVLALALRLAFAPGWRAAFVALSPIAAVGTRLAALTRGAALALVFFDRTICDASPVVSLLDVRAGAGAVVVVALGYLAWKRRGPALLLAVSLLPALNLVPVMRWWSPHYFYIALIFAAMLIGQVVDGRGPRVLVVAAATMIALAVTSARDARRFRTDQSLWGAEIATNPVCREGHFYVGEGAREVGDWERAAFHYERAAQATADVLSYVDLGAALQNLGAVRLQQGRFTDAVGAFDRALATRTDASERRRLVHNLATAHLRAGNAAEAARLLDPERERPDAFPGSLLVLARALHDLGRADDAAAVVRQLQRAAGNR